MLNVLYKVGLAGFLFEKPYFRYFVHCEYNKSLWACMYILYVYVFVMVTGVRY